MCDYVATQKLRQAHRKYNCGRHQEARGRPIPDRHSTRKEELSNLSPIHGSTYSKIPFWHGSRNPWHKIPTYLWERYTNKDNTKERSAWARLCSTSEWICSSKNLFALDLVFISDQIIEFRGEYSFASKERKRAEGQRFSTNFKTDLILPTPTSTLAWFACPSSKCSVNR